MYKKLIPYCLALGAAFSVAQAAHASPGNLAPTSHITVSEESAGFPKEYAIDGRMDTRWSVVPGSNSGQWLQLAWDSPRTVCGVVLYQPYPYVTSLDIQVWQNGGWVTVSHAESSTKLPQVITAQFSPVTTQSLRVANIAGGPTFWEIEVYGDPLVFADLLAELSQATIAVAGDARGNLIGTVSRDTGGTPVADTVIDASGATPAGPWTRTCRTDGNGFFKLDMPLGTEGTIDLVAKTPRPSSNLALTASGFSVSESWPGYPGEYAIDGRMDTRWSVVPGSNSGQWLRIDWSAPQQIEKVVIHQPYPYVTGLDVQVKQGDSWVTVAHAGLPDPKPPMTITLTFPAQVTQSVRIADISNGPTFWEVEVYGPGSGVDMVEAGRLSVASSDISKCLTPRPADPAERLSLEGAWDFAPDPPADFLANPDSVQWRPISVPSNWEMEGFASQTGKGLYRRTFTIPAAWLGKRVKFRSDGVYSVAEVWVNGVRAGSHEGGATPFELDVTNLVQPGGANTILVLVTATSASSRMDNMSYYADFSLAGIWRPLEVFCVEPHHVSRLAVTTDLDANYTDANLSIEVDIANEQPSPIQEADLVLKVTDADGSELPLTGLSARVSLAGWERRKLTLSATVTSPDLWNAERPRLYTLSAELRPSGMPASVAAQRFGFKEVEITGRTYKINGKAVKMWGACRHDAHPLMGRAITPAVARQDIELMKGANLNAMRTSHYPPHPAALDAADELGVYVEDEAPFCWTTASDAEDLRLAPFVIGVTSEMLERDRNHPSVVIWSLCNESSFGRDFSMSHDFVRASDPTRPTSAGQSANMEIATYHNPTSMQRMFDTANFQMPVLFDEGLGIFQGFGAQSGQLDLDPGLRDFWITPHFDPIAAIRASEHHLGTQIWAWVDDAFLVPGRGVETGRVAGQPVHFCDAIYTLPGRGIVGYPPWGLIDGWRRPRPEWWLAKKLFSPIQITEGPIELPLAAQPVTVAVTNLNSFINLSEYLCKWRIAEQSGELRADVPAGVSGFVSFTPTLSPAADDVLVLEFYDETGRLVDGYRLPFSARQVTALPYSGAPAQILDQSGLIRLKGLGTQLVFNKTSGLLMAGTAGVQTSLTTGLNLHVMKNNAPLEQYPTGWHFTGATYGVESGKAVLHWNGTYGDFAGGFTIRMDNGGDVEIDYSFAYSGSGVTAKEIGIALGLPLAATRLEWDRRAEWSYYPDDEIGRPHGVAFADSTASQEVPPTNRPFALDDHAKGSNDFRSAKRGIYWATFSTPVGAGVRVVSDGDQHLRATVSSSSTSLKVLDYYGGSATGANEWDGAYGNGRYIAPGSTLAGTVKLQLLEHVPTVSVRDLSEAKSQPDGTTVSISRAKIVTVGSSTFTDGCSYVEEPTRASGIKLMGASLTEGEAITLEGVMRTDANGERLIQVTAITSRSDGAL